MILLARRSASPCHRASPPSLSILSLRLLPPCFPRHASTRIPLLRPTGVNPPLFHQTIVHSDGSTFTLRSTSPRTVLKLTKDARNHALWNPALNVLDDQSGELAKFERAYADYDLEAFAEFEEDPETVAKKKVKVVEAPAPVAPAKKGKKK
ncbi:hypothetical protein HKX48_006823 [Thoreauomyces humboldtii]|nr:hypothetical protein HKX48_006823 [Thoreauomyces humboldtii]